jgi:hypothetical protein
MSTSYSPNVERFPAVKHLQRYGLDIDEYLKLLAIQGGVCQICNRPEFLNIDHDHLSGKARGLLCSSCNYALGCLKDDPRLLLEAWAYLKAPPAQYIDAKSWIPALRMRPLIDALREIADKLESQIAAGVAPEEGLTQWKSLVTTLLDAADKARDQEESRRTVGALGGRPTGGLGGVPL